MSITKVKPMTSHRLLLTFENNEEKIFDINPYLNIGKFKELKDERLFNTVKVCFDTIRWDNDLDLDPHTLYAEAYNKPKGKQV